MEQLHLIWQQCMVILMFVSLSSRKVRKKSNGDTPLHEACGNGYLGICKLIMTYIGKENVINMLGETPLHYAALMGHFLVCEWLIENTTDPNPEDEEGKTPYQYAVEAGHEKIIELLKPYSFH
jgi:ankyrin repeat protein